MTSTATRNRALSMGLPVLVFVVLFGLTGRAIINATGHIAYGLDDPYIHMAIAKNLALHGVWGVAPNTFAAASSSPIWTAMVAAVFLATGIHDAVPLLLNLFIALTGIVLLGAALTKERLSPLEAAAVAIGVIFFAPLVPMVWVGMEHTLHIALAIAAAWLCRRCVRAATSEPVFAWLVAVSMAMTLTRYEGLFVVAGCALVLLVARRVAAAIAVAAAGALPVIGVGLWNLSHGWYFLPASIMVKQTVLPQAQALSLPARLLHNVATSNAPPEFLALLAVALVLLLHRAVRTRSLTAEPQLVVFVCAALLRLPLAKFGWVYRYEAYLVALGVFATGLALLGHDATADTPVRARRSRGDVALATLAVAVALGANRTLVSPAAVVTTAAHIDRQHRPMAEFLARYYDGRPVALNDIGKVSYSANVQVHDLIGLASLDATMLRARGEFDRAHVNAWLDRDDVRVALIYDSLFQGAAAFQDDWIRVGQWDTDGNDIVEGRVSFYARDVASARELAANMRAFAAQLPQRVTQSVDVQAPGP